MNEPLTKEEFNELFRWSTATALESSIKWGPPDRHRIQDMTFRALLELAYCEDNVDRKWIINQEVKT